MNHQNIANIRDRIQQSSSIVIVTHTNPDGDAIGSSLGFYHYLLSLNPAASVKVIVPNEFPSFLKWMPAAEDIMVYQLNENEIIKYIEKAELCLCLDFNSLKRTDKLFPYLEASKAFKILIDHHPQPENDFDVMISSIESSSTSELIYDVISSISGAGALNQDIASCLYVGIMTDTGSFSYSCRRPETYLAVAELIRHNIDSELIHRKIYDTYSENRMRLLGFCLSERLTVLKDFHTAYIYLTKDDLNHFYHQNGDTEGVVNYALSIEGIVLAVLFTEKEDRIRISMRSKGEFNVNEMARKHFNGGGHKNASGGDSFASMSETLIFFESILPEYQDDITKSVN
ncbi:MAG: DHH family phosphoesterase [Bacteroidota bacterium]|nr:DHH family phosphoesterase [Bacteroidota bacterium]